MREFLEQFIRIKFLNLKNDLQHNYSNKTY
jgi:hypothetical protein